MEFIEIGLKLLGLILIISLFFSLVRFLVQKYLSDFYQGITKAMIKMFNSIKGIFRKVS